MASKIKVDQIEGAGGSTITIPTGQTLTITDGLAASTIGSGTLDVARLPTVTVAKGGTNLSSYTAGDLLYATGSTTLAKLAKGTSAQTLKMNSGATAPEWTTVAAASSDIVKLASTAVSGATTVAFDGYFSATYNRYEIVISDITMAGTSSDFYFRVRAGDATITSSIYNNTNAYQYTDTTPSVSLAPNNSGSNDMNAPDTYWRGNHDAIWTDAHVYLHFMLYNPLSTTKWKMMEYNYGYTGNTIMDRVFGHGVIKQNAALSGMEVISSSDNWSGTANLYGYK